MADPFSILAGTLGVADVCWRIAKYLKDVKASAATVEEDINLLIHEVEALMKINDCIEKTFEADISKSSNLSPLKSGHLEKLWQHTGKSLEDSKAIVEKLEDIVKEIYGETGPKVVGKIDGLRKLGRKNEKKAELCQIRYQLSTCQSSFQILLTGIGVLVASLWTHIEILIS
jgi:hypothetical protein